MTIHTKGDLLREVLRKTFIIYERALLTASAASPKDTAEITDSPELSIISFLPTAILYFLIVHVIGRIVHPLDRFIIMLAKQVVAKGKMGYIQEEAVLSFRNHRAA